MFNSFTFSSGAEVCGINLLLEEWQAWGINCIAETRLFIHSAPYET